MPCGRFDWYSVTAFEERPAVMRADQVLSKRGGNRMQVPRVE